MKQTISLILALVLCLSLCACDGKNNEMEQTNLPEESTISKAETTTPTIETTPIPNWTIGYYVDEFGDPTDDAYLFGGAFYGNFSNTATSGSALKVYLYDTPFYANPRYSYINENGHFTYSADANNTLCFRLLEYYDTKATFFSSSNITLKVKIDDKTYETELWGSSPNSDLYLDSKVYGGNELYSALIKALEENKTIKCIIMIDSDKYSFEIDGLGYGEASQQLKDMCGYH